MEYLESSKRGKEAKLREEWEETRGLRVGDRKRGKKKKAGLLLPANTQALQDFSLGLQRREDWNLALPEPKFEFLARGVGGPSTRFLLRDRKK